MAFTEAYPYPKLERVEKDGMRRYDVNGDLLPSVTTILSYNKDDSFLDEWKERVGEDEAKRIVDESCSIGSVVHDNLENYVLHGAKPTGTILEKIMTKTIIDKGLCHLDEAWGCEAMLYVRGLYAGTADLVGVYKSAPAIVDYKNSRRQKKEEWIEDYFKQLAAYGVAHNEMFGTKIRHGHILMVDRDSKFYPFEISGKKYDKYMYAWLKDVDAWHQANS